MKNADIVGFTGKAKMFVQNGTFSATSTARLNIHFVDHASKSGIVYTREEVDQ